MHIWKYNQIWMVGGWIYYLRLTLTILVRGRFVLIRSSGSLISIHSNSSEEVSSSKAGLSTPPNTSVKDRQNLLCHAFWQAVVKWQGKAFDFHYYVCMDTCIHMYVCSKAMWAAGPVANTTATCQLKRARKDVIVDVKIIKSVFANMVLPILLK